MIGFLAPLSPNSTLGRQYRSYQCGLCHALGAEYGLRYRLFAGPDMVFLNIFFDLVGAEPAREGRRACVLAPGVTNLPARVATERTAFAAAFGVYMAVEKLRDDWEDERSPLTWLAWRAFRPGWVRARAELQAQAFPVEEVEAQMDAQRAIERGGAHPLAEASEPTRAIARLLFGHAARAAGEAARPGLEALGDRVGGFLFYLDNLLDLHQDLRRGGYNALARAFGITSEVTRLPDAVVTAEVAGARAQVDDLEGLVAALPVSGERAYVSRTLVAGFRDKLHRYEALSDEARRTATLKSVLPPRPVGFATETLARAVARPIAQARYRVRLTVALLAMWLAPRASWAQDWWPEDAGLDTADPSLLDTGAEAATAGAYPAGPLVTGDECCDCDFEGCCEGVCSDACPCPC